MLLGVKTMSCPRTQPAWHSCRITNLLLTLLYMFRPSQSSSGMPINEKKILKTITIGGHGGKVLQNNLIISCRRIHGC